MNALKLHFDDQKSLCEIIRKDLKDYYEKVSHKYNSSKPFCVDFGLRADLSWRTVYRILQNENFKPNFNSTVNIYLSIHGVDSYVELFNKVEWFEEYSKRHTFVDSNSIDNKAGQQKQNKEINNYLRDRELSLNIYLYVSGFGTTMENLKDKFGDYGLKEAFKMVELNILRVDGQKITWNERNQILINPESLGFMAASLIKNYLRPEASHIPNENFIGSTVTNVSPQGKQKILQEMEIFQRKLVTLIQQDDLVFKESEQTEKLFVVAATDKVI